MELLSICIPTYNRKQRLRKLLNKIKKWNTNNIPVIVFDNASSDGTENMMRKEFSNIVYLRNEKNLGHDGNYLRIVEEGKKYSEYSLWLGDDDCVTKEFFADIPKILQNREHQLIILNYLAYQSSILKKLIYFLGIRKQNSGLQNKKDVVLTSIEMFFLGFWDKLSFGIMIVKNDLLCKYSAIRYMGTYHLYGGAIYDMLDEQQKKYGKISVLVTEKPYLITGKGEKSYKHLMKEVAYGIGKFFAFLPSVLNKQSEMYINWFICNNLFDYISEVERGYKENRKTVQQKD